MTNIKPRNWNYLETAGFIVLLLLIIIHGYIREDAVISIISAVCGISYTYIAGKGNPICYFFGVIGSGFYAYLSFTNAIWGNLILYLGYYIPMQILGFFQWRKNLKQEKNEIIKTSLKTVEFIKLIAFLLLFSLILSCILYIYKDLHPIADSITTIFSIGGMYLTVRRAIQQWILWMIVNSLSLIMWINIALSGERVLSTVIMWAVYLILAFYFYYRWRKELD